MVVDGFEDMCHVLEVVGMYMGDPSGIRSKDGGSTSWLYLTFCKVGKPNVDPLP